MIHLEIPARFKPLATQAHRVASGLFRPISRKYDQREHEFPEELKMLGAVLRGMSEATGSVGASSLGDDGKVRAKGDEGKARDKSKVKNGANMSTLLGMIELCWGDVGLALSIPGQGLGNAAIDAVGTPEQKARYRGTWAAMAITAPNAGSDSPSIRTRTRLDGVEWVLNGEN